MYFAPQIQRQTQRRKSLHIFKMSMCALVLHAYDATQNSTSSSEIYSLNTFVLVLLIQRYPDLCENNIFVTGVGLRSRTISVRDIFNSLGPHKADALPCLHAISGADNTGSFIGKAKINFWKSFQCASVGSIIALQHFGTVCVNELTCMNAHLYKWAHVYVDKAQGWDKMHGLMLG